MTLVDGVVNITEQENQALSEYLVNRFGKYRLPNNGIIQMESFVDQHIRKNIQISRTDKGNRQYLFGDKDFWQTIKEQLGENLVMYSTITVENEDPISLRISFGFRERNHQVLD